VGKSTFGFGIDAVFYIPNNFNSLINLKSFTFSVKKPKLFSIAFVKLDDDISIT